MYQADEGNLHTSTTFAFRSSLYIKALEENYISYPSSNSEIVMSSTNIYGEIESVARNFSCSLEIHRKKVLNPFSIVSYIAHNIRIDVSLHKRTKRDIF